MDIKQILEKYIVKGELTCPTKTIGCVKSCVDCMTNEIKSSISAELEKLKVKDPCDGCSNYRTNVDGENICGLKSCALYEEYKAKRTQLQHDIKKIKELLE